MSVTIENGRRLTMRTLTELEALKTPQRRRSIIRDVYRSWSDLEELRKTVRERGCIRDAARKLATDDIFPGWPMVAGGQSSSGHNQIFILNAAAHNPADATAYFWGCFGPAVTPTTSTLALYRQFFPRDGVVVRVIVMVLVAGTLGSTETGTVEFRLNNTTNTTVSSSVQFNNVIQAYEVEIDPPIAVSFGDYFEMKVTTPTWTTNPTSVVYSSTTWVE